MSVYKQPKSKYWSYRFKWHGKEIRKSTKVTNKRAAEQMEAAARTALAKGEVGIKDLKHAPTLAEFLDHDFLPFVRTTKAKEPKTVQFYEGCATNLKAHKKLGSTTLDEIDHDLIQAFIKSRQAYRQERKGNKPLEVSTINRDLATLRRALLCAQEWGRVSATVKVRLLPGENRRERALSEVEDAAYMKAATSLANDLELKYAAALTGIRAMKRGQEPIQPDAFLLRDVALVLLDAAVRPDECNRLKPENIRDGAICIFEGKTKAARRRIPIMTERLKAALDMRLAVTAPGAWLFPAPTKSGHIEASTLSKVHAKALKASGVLPFEIYTMRHTCLTRWGEYMDPWKLHKYAGHADFKTTQRYIHPRDESMQDAMDRNRTAREVRIAQGGHTLGHTDEGEESGEIRRPATN
jgi:integrase